MKSRSETTNSTVCTGRPAASSSGRSSRKLDRTIRCTRAALPQAAQMGRIDRKIPGKRSAQRLVSCDQRAQALVDLAVLALMALLHGLHGEQTDPHAHQGHQYQSKQRWQQRVPGTEISGSNNVTTRCCAGGFPERISPLRADSATVIGKRGMGGERLQSAWRLPVSACEATTQPSIRRVADEPRSSPRQHGRQREKQRQHRQLALCRHHGFGHDLHHDPQHHDMEQVELITMGTEPRQRASQSAGEDACRQPGNRDKEYRRCDSQERRAQRLVAMDSPHVNPTHQDAGQPCEHPSIRASQLYFPGNDGRDAAKSQHVDASQVSIQVKQFVIPVDAPIWAP